MPHTIIYTSEVLMMIYLKTSDLAIANNIIIILGAKNIDVLSSASVRLTL